MCYREPQWPSRSGSIRWQTGAGSKLFPRKGSAPRGDGAVKRRNRAAASGPKQGQLKIGSIGAAYVREVFFLFFNLFCIFAFFSGFFSKKNRWKR